MVLSKYVSNDKLEQFVKDHEIQIADLQKGSISGVFVGFQKRGNPNETYDARISLKRQKEEGTEKMFVTPTFTFKNKTLTIPKSFNMDGVQVQLTDRQYNELVNDGRLAETLKFTGQSGIKREMFVAIDMELNRIAWVPATFFRVPDTIYQTQVNQEQKDALSSGKKAQMDIAFKGGKQTVLAYYDPVLHKIRFERAHKSGGETEKPTEKMQTEQVKEETAKNEPTKKLEGKQKQQTKRQVKGKQATLNH